MSGIWPGDIRCVAMLTFDLDGQSSWRQRNPDFAHRPSLMSMAEYGPAVAAPRILELLDSYSIKATFFVPGWVAETHEELVREVYRRGHEIGHHGYMHEPPAALGSAQEEAQALDRASAALQRVTGERPRGYRAPGWAPSEHTLSLLSERGFLYDSSLMGDDVPHFVDAGNGARFVEVPVHWEWDDFPYFAFVPDAGIRGPMQSPDAVFSTWALGFDGVHRWGLAFCLTMHPQIIGRPARLLMLERLVRHMRAAPDVAFMRCVDVAQMWADKE